MKKVTLMLFSMVIAICAIANNPTGDFSNKSLYKSDDFNKFGIGFGIGFGFFTRRMLTIG